MPLFLSLERRKNMSNFSENIHMEKKMNTRDIFSKKNSIREVFFMYKLFFNPLIVFGGSIKLNALKMI